MHSKKGVRADLFSVTPFVFYMALNQINSHIRHVIDHLAGEKFKRFVKLYSAWKGVVGELLAERSHPIKIERDTLFVGVENSAWMQELILLKPQIIQKYRAQFDEELRDIVLVINSKGKKK